MKKAFLVQYDDNEEAIRDPMPTVHIYDIDDISDGYGIIRGKRATKLYNQFVLCLHNIDGIDLPHRTESNKEGGTIYGISEKM